MSPVTSFPSSSDEPLAAWAHAYAAGGFPVFPLIPRDKRPATRNGFKNATTKLDVVDWWWEQHPDYNIGIATGHTFDVLDVDGERGVANLTRHIGEKYFHHGPLVLTGRGWHLLFAPTGRGNGAALLGPESKVDFRGLGGYVVAPPSIHPLGHRYIWDTNRGPTTPLQPAPDWLATLLDRTTALPQSGPTARVAKNEIIEQLQRDGYIPADQVPRGARLRFDRPDILDVAAALGISFRRRGSYHIAACIFHEDSTPSMGLYTHNNTFYCYGCGAHGDSFDLQERKHI